MVMTDAKKHHYTLRNIAAKGWRRNNSRYLKKICDEVSNDGDTNLREYDNIFEREPAVNEKVRRRSRGKGAGRPTTTCAPTKTPSMPPSPIPSRISTVNPTWTMTMPFSDLEVAYVTDGSTSQCKTNSPTPKITEDQVFAFKYNVYLSSLANKSNAVGFVEILLHSKMAENLLICDYDDEAAFDVVSIGSNPDATITSDECDTTNDPVPPMNVECFVVISQLNITVHFSSSDQLQDTKENSGVMDAVSDYLNSTMANGDFVWGEIMQTSFQGFLGNDDSDPTGVAQASAVNSVNSALGSVMVAVATLCFFMIVAFVVQHKRQRKRAFLKHLEAVNASNESTRMDGSEPGLEYLSSKIQLVLGDLPSGNFPQEENHDVHHCASATCPICSRNQANPTFFSRTEGASGFIRFDTPSMLFASRSYDDSLDTVNL
jgi:hypothetical protein